MIDLIIDMMKNWPSKGFSTDIFFNSRQFSLSVVLSVHERSVRLVFSWLQTANTYANWHFQQDGKHVNWTLVATALKLLPQIWASFSVSSAIAQQNNFRSWSSSSLVVYAVLLLRLEWLCLIPVSCVGLSGAQRKQTNWQLDFVVDSMLLSLD